MTYTDLLEQFKRNIGFTGGTLDSTIEADFQNNLAQRYFLVQSKLKNYITQNTYTQATVANQQYYDYPLAFMNVEDVVVTVGSVNYPLTVINSQHNWDILNAIQIQASAIPQFIFPRSPYLGKDQGGGYGIWPIPQAIYTITFNQHYRDRGLNIADYTTGTVALTNDSPTITGSGTTFTRPMVGRYLEITDQSNNGYGYQYLITGWTSTTVLTMAPNFQGTTGSGFTYRIGQQPALPLEAHILLVDGATADYYGGMRKDPVSNVYFNNKFWTGDGNNAQREQGSSKIAGGLLGLMTRYAERNNDHLIQRRPRLSPLNYQVWATTLSS